MWLVGLPGDPGIDFLSLVAGREVADGLDSLAGNVAVEGPDMGFMRLARLEVELAWAIWFLDPEAGRDFIGVERCEPFHFLVEVDGGPQERLELVAAPGIRSELDIA